MYTRITNTLSFSLVGLHSLFSFDFSSLVFSYSLLFYSCPLSLLFPFVFSRGYLYFSASETEEVGCESVAPSKLKLLISLST